ncbi:MAG TPA: ABC transporter substrate-binding protein [Allosphingosinicella sp.]
MSPSELGRRLGAPGFGLPAWLGAGDDSTTGPLIVLAESAGTNVMDLMAACRLALDDAGRSARLVVGDDRRDPERAAALAAAAAPWADCCIGHFGSRTARPASRIYGERGVPFLAPGCSADDLCGPHAPTTLQLFGRDAEQRACLADAARAAGGSAVIVGQTGNYGADLAQGLAADLKDIGVLACSLLSLDELERKPPSPGAGARALILCGSKEFARAGLAALAGRGPQAALLLSDDSFGADFSPLLPVGARGGVAFLRETSATLLDQDADRLRRRAQRMLGTAPGAYFETSYLAVRAFVEAWARAGPADRAGWRESLLSQRWPTPFGELSLSPEGRLRGHVWALRPFP